MTDPVAFAAATPRFALPFLYAGQAQKEVFVNEAHALTDALLHCAIEGVRPDAPDASVDGMTWLVSDGASGAWAGKSGNLACRQAGNWLFVPPRDGMRVLDRTTGQDLRYYNGWQFVSPPEPANGGTTVDSEARAMLYALVVKLRDAGIFATV